MAIRPSPSSFMWLKLHILFRSLRSTGTVANRPGRGRKRKIDVKMKRRIIRMVTKEPRTTSEEIRGELQGQGPSVSDRIMRRCLSQVDFMEDDRGGHHCWKQIIKMRHWNLLKWILTSHKAFGRMSFEQMRQNWSFLASHISSMFTDAKRKHTKKRTLYLLWHM